MTINITDEIANFKNDSENIKTTIKKLEIQQEETKKQLYLFKVLNLVQELEEMIKDKVFEKVGIYTADINVSVDEDIGNIIKLSPYDEDNLFVDECYYDKNEGIVDIKEVQTINHLFSTLNGLNREDISDDLKLNKIETFKIEEGCTKIILDALLSKELKTILEYGEMQHDLSTTNEIKTNKIKI